MLKLWGLPSAYNSQTSNLARIEEYLISSIQMSIVYNSCTRLWAIDVDFTIVVFNVTAILTITLRKGSILPPQKIPEAFFQL